MATKKRKPKQPPTIKPLVTRAITTASAANDMFWKLCGEREKASDLDLKKDEDTPTPTWRDVALLYQGQVDLLRLVADLYEKLEDPIVAQVVTFHATIQEMKVRMEELTAQFERHEERYDHTRTDPYY